MKKQLLILFLACITGFGFYSCKKKYQVIPPPVPSSSIRDSIVNNFNQNRQYFSFNGLTGDSVTTNEGIVFYVPYYTFRDAIGDTIIGTIDVEIIELLSVNDMLSQDKPTTSDGEVLVTGGQFKNFFYIKR